MRYRGTDIDHGSVVLEEGNQLFLEKTRFIRNG
jgi:hypothetical protein